MLYPFNYTAPKSKSLLLTFLSEKAGEARILAGGTDLMILLRQGIGACCTVVDIKKISEFKKLSYSKTEGLSIGPAVTIDEIIRSRDVTKYYPLLSMTAKELGSVQVRNRATVVGNICNASPCADMALSLLCLDSSVVITSKCGSRTVKLAGFFKGVKKTVLKPGEIAEKIIVPAETADARGGFRKLKRIKGHDISLASVCLYKKGSAVRVSVGSAHITPVLLKPFKSGISAAEVWAEAEKTLRPIDDIRSSKDYRLFMIKNYIEELLHEVK